MCGPVEDHSEFRPEHALASTAPRHMAALAPLTGDAAPCDRRCLSLPQLAVIGWHEHNAMPWARKDADQSTGADTELISERRMTA